MMKPYLLNYSLTEHPLVDLVLKSGQHLTYAHEKTEFPITSDFHSKQFQNLVNLAIDCPEKPKEVDFKSHYTSSSYGYDSVVLLSGGADSTINWILNGFPRGIYVNIGHAYSDKEVDVVTKLSEKLQKPVDIIDLRESKWINQSMGYGKNGWRHIIPLRNLLMLLVAGTVVNNYGDIYFSVVEGEGYNSHKGDKSKTFIDSFCAWFLETTGKRVNVKTMHEKTKAQWLKQFVESGWDYRIIRNETVTCFGGGERHCGHCQACFRKFEQFYLNGYDITEDFVVDPKIGCKEYIEKYKVVMKEAVEKQDFSHYSKQRCEETLYLIDELGL